MNYTQDLKVEQGATSLAEHAKLMRVMYDNETIENAYSRWGGMEKFTTKRPNWQRGMGNTYRFEFKDRTTMDEVQIQKFVTQGTDENGCPIDEFGECPTRICTPSTYRVCELKLDTTFQVGVSWCEATDGLFVESKYRAEYEDKMEALRESVHYALWLTLMEVATTSPSDTIIENADFTTHYFVTTDELYTALLCAVTYMKQVLGSKSNELCIFLPYKVEKCLLQDEAFKGCCKTSGPEGSSYANSVALAEQGGASSIGSFHGLPLILLSEGIDAPGGNPFCPDPATARILIAHPDAFVWHTEVMVNADECKDAESFNYKMNTLIIGGCKVLRPDLLFVLEFTCE